MLALAVAAGVTVVVVAVVALIVSSVAFCRSSALQLHENAEYKKHYQTVTNVVNDFTLSSHTDKCPPKMLHLLKDYTPTLVTHLTPASFLSFASSRCLCSSLCLAAVAASMLSCVKL